MSTKIGGNGPTQQQERVEREDKPWIEYRKYFASLYDDSNYSSPLQASVTARKHVNACNNLIALIRFDFSNFDMRWWPLTVPLLDINLFFCHKC